MLSLECRGHQHKPWQINEDNRLIKGHQNIYPIVCKPWMRQTLIRCVSFFCIKNKKLWNEILQKNRRLYKRFVFCQFYFHLCYGWHHIKVGLIEVIVTWKSFRHSTIPERSFFNLLKWLLTFNPPVASPEWGFSPREKEVSYGAHSPHVRGSAGKLAVHHLGRHELQSPTHGHLEVIILSVKHVHCRI